VAASHIEIASIFRTLPSPDLQAWLALELLPVTLPWYGEGMYLVSATSVAQAQVGYAVLGDGTPAKNWPAGWVVIGNVSSDPLIVDPAIEGTPVFYAVHGTGKWVREPLAPSLESFARSLAFWVTAIGETGTVQEDSVLRTPVESTVRTQIANLVGADCLPLWLGRHWLD
jgi:hypothetical protein